MKRIGKWIRWGIVLGLGLSVWGSFAPALHAQSSGAVAERFDVEIQVRPDGTMEVAEHQTIRFNGTFRRGFREIPLRRTEGITILDLRDDEATYRREPSGQPFTYEVEESREGITVRWFFPPTTNAVRTFHLRYQVRGAIRRYPEGDQLWWNPLPAEHAYEIRRSTVTVVLPPGALAQRIAAYGPADGEILEGGRTVRFQVRRPLQPDESFEIRIQFPHGILPPEPPAWQVQEDRLPLYNLGLLALGLLLLVGGPALALALWAARGRDPDVGVVPDQLAEPPSTDPPAMVGVLLDERADLRDILATVVDLARRGVLTIEEIREGFRRDFILRRTGQENDLRPFEAVLLRALFNGSPARRLGELRYRFFRRLPEIEAALYRAVAQAGWFAGRPDRVRGRYQLLAFAFGGLAVLAGIAAGNWSGEGLWGMWAVAVGLGGTALAWFLIAPHMPRKTRKGAELAARWRAFARGLRRLQQLAPDEARARLEAYLPYAIAFGMERRFLRQWQELAPDLPPPPWYRPWIDPHPASAPGRVPGHAAPVPSPGGLGVPSLDDAATALTGGLNAFAESLTGMLNTAADTFVSRPPSDRGGGGRWSGGGGFGGGGGGGGRSGFG
ncbi:hypothetical protein HRbin22_02428 [Candidatus Thermoflexus japonica]|uniref:DUF2207 domain-containing protein n=1 Tax=Candidatus Thermoflexus japonica TaxID=2035417 RepID=A0A2H5Y9S3_9CHLR|nr:hypothetical protein HRbin22_02428 [Candidatus Thermoflexus japonica]